MCGFLLFVRGGGVGRPRAPLDLCLGHSNVLIEQDMKVCEAIVTHINRFLRSSIEYLHADLTLTNCFLCFLKCSRNKFVVVHKLHWQNVILLPTSNESKLFYHRLLVKKNFTMCGQRGKINMPLSSKQETSGFRNKYVHTVQHLGPSKSGEMMQKFLILVESLHHEVSNNNTRFLIVVQ